MKITKYEHACLVLEDQGKKLVIDPGGWTETFGTLENIVAVVITHQHGDHCNPAHVAAIAAANPAVQVFSTSDVAGQLTTPAVTAVAAGQTVQAGPFGLQFYGGQHAVIQPSVPPIQNIGVLVNQALYYPGDSFSVPDQATVTALALPVSAPWLKVSEVMDFFAAIKPTICFATHNALLSERGEELLDGIVGDMCAQAGTTYYSLRPGQAIEI
jgi:L-ascorbate metabolism protein UlaG (beta-lactamase superfamily)